MGMMAGASLAAAEEKPTDAGDADGAQLAPAGTHPASGSLPAVA